MTDSDPVDLPSAEPGAPEAAARPAARARRRRARPADEAPRGGGPRQVDYRTLRNPFPPVPVFTEDRVHAIHEAALQVLEELGVMILLPEARALYRAGGARVDDASQMVHIGREIVEAALATAPKSIQLRGGARHRDLTWEIGTLTFQPGAGAPHATDRERGRRPGSLQDYRELVTLTQSFDALHIVPPLIEPQDVPVHLRHYAMTEAALTLSDKIPPIYARGAPQVLDCFEMVADFRGLSDDAFRAASH
ncbi:MAG: trimethylamine methyltransferase family protein, partial [Pseudomonadota bacterium]